MSARPILFLDSGIGGIPYCRYFHARNPAESIVYLADRQHFPYGTRERQELVTILSALVEQVVSLVNPGIAVIACNTATVSALAELRERFPMFPFVGTVPAVKPAALASKTGKVGVLATERTIADSYIRELAAQYGAEIAGIAAPELVEFVECRCTSAAPEEKREVARGYVERFRTAGIDTMVLGCTHFLFLKEEFCMEAAPDITVFDSLEGISRRIESLLAEQGMTAAAAETAAPNRLLITGSWPLESSWQDWADRLGFRISLLEEA